MLCCQVPGEHSTDFMTASTKHAGNAESMLNCSKFQAVAPGQKGRRDLAPGSVMIKALARKFDFKL